MRGKPSAIFFCLQFDAGQRRAFFFRLDHANGLLIDVE
jgi:hypothetical protein